MSICMFWKVFGDLCLCYAVVSSMPLLFAHEMSFLWVALICGLGAGVAGILVEQGKSGYRYWALAFPAVTLFLAGSLLEIWMLVPAVTYTAMLVVRGNMELEYYPFRSFYLKSLAALAAYLAIIGLMFGFESSSRQETMSLDMPGAIGYGALYAFSGILLLRRIRLGIDNRDSARKANGLQLMLMLGGTVALVVTVVVTEQVFHEDLLELLATTIPIVIATPFVLLAKVLEVFLRLFAMLPNFQQLEELLEQGEGSWSDAVTEPTETEEVIQVVEESGFPWWAVLMVLGILMIVLAAMLQILRSHRDGQASGETIGTVEPERRKQKRQTRSNRSKVRKLYRAYLKAEQNSGVVLKPNHTSADILELASAETDKDAAAALRQVYLRARYDDSGEISAVQVRKAKEALRASRK